MVVTGFAVAGLTCGVCLAALLERLRAVDDVREAAADLVVGGATSVVVTSGSAVRVESMRRAVEQAGFVLTSSDQFSAPRHGSGHLLAARAYSRAGDNESRKEGVRR